MSGAERRRAILETAIRMFAERGFRGVTTRELAQMVGVSEPVLYQHFPSKRDLYSAIIEHKISQTEELKGRLEDLCLTPLEPREFFFQLAMLSIEWHSADPTFIRLLFYAQLEGHELAKLFHVRMVEDYFRLVVDAVSRMAGLGATRLAPPEVAAYGFLSMIHNHCQDELFQTLPITGLTREETVRCLVDIYLNGLIQDRKTSNEQ
jgi:AcrR family transcriptional regulator